MWFCNWIYFSLISSTVTTDVLKCPRPNFPYFFTKTNSKEYQQINRPVFQFNPQQKKYRLLKNFQRKEKEKKGPEHEKEIRHKSLGIAIGSGIAVAAIAVGIAVFLIKKRERTEDDLITNERHRNYNTCDHETLL